MEEVTVHGAYDAGLLYIPNEVRDDVLRTHGDTNFGELKTMAQPFMCEHIRVLCSKLDIFQQFVYLMKDCEGDMQWSNFYGRNDFRSSCLKAHELDLMTVFNVCQSAIRTSAPFNEYFWYGVQHGRVVEMYK